MKNDNEKVAGIVIGIVVVAGASYWVYIKYIKPKLDSIKKVTNIV